MKPSRSFAMFAVSAATLASLGCSHNNYYASAPPPPPAYQPSPLLELAERNGFQTGRSDGARDVDSGAPYRARATRAYHDTPGYDSHLGPFGIYRNAFRDSYLRGYDKGFRRG